MSENKRLNVQERMENEEYISDLFNNKNNCLMFVRFITTLQERCSKCGDVIEYDSSYEAGHIKIIGECATCDDGQITIEITFTEKCLIDIEELHFWDAYDVINALISQFGYKMTIKK